MGMDFAGGHDARTRPAGNSLDVAGPTPAVLPADLEVVNAGNSANPSEAPSAPQHAEGASCPSCGGPLDALLRADMSPALGAIACRACGWGATGAALRHLKPLPEDAE